MSVNKPIHSLTKSGLSITTCKSSMCLKEAFVQCKGVVSSAIFHGGDQVIAITDIHRVNTGNDTLQLLIFHHITSRNKHDTLRKRRLILKCLQHSDGSFHVHSTYSALNVGLRSKERHYEGWEFNFGR